MNWPLVAQVCTPIASLFIGAALNRAIEKRTKLVVFAGHAATHRMPPLPTETEGLTVISHSLVIRNDGKVAAKNVRIGHGVMPEELNISPPIPYTKETLPDGTIDVVIATFIPSEQVTLSYLHFAAWTPEQVLKYVKSDEGYAKILKYLPTRVYPKWANVTAGILMVFGFAAIVYLLVAGIIALVG